MGLLEKRNHTCGRRGCRSRREGGEGSRCSSITLESLHFSPKARKQHGQRLEPLWLRVGWAGGAGLDAGRPLDGARPGEGAAEGEVDGLGPCLANTRWDALGDCRWKKVKGGAGEDPLVEWVMAPSLR